MRAPHCLTRPSMLLTRRQQTLEALFWKLMQTEHGGPDTGSPAWGAWLWAVLAACPSLQQPGLPALPEGQPPQAADPQLHRGAGPAQGLC